MQSIKDTTIGSFLNNLQNEGKSKVSIKNYKSDIGHFLAWSILKLKSYGTYVESVLEIIPFINYKFFSDYKDYMVENGIKTKTVNRRLSTLRNFSKFLYSTNMIDQDFAAGIQNVGIGVVTNVQKKAADIVEGFRESLLKGGKASENTVKNYASDVRSFLAWMNEKGDLPNGL